MDRGIQLISDLVKYPVDFALARPGIAALLSLLIYYTYRILSRFELLPTLTPSAYTLLPCPPRKTIIGGHRLEIFEDEPGLFYEDCIEKYGNVFQTRLSWGAKRINIADPKALNHMLTYAYDFPKPDFARGRKRAVRNQLATLLGRGVLFAEGTEHKRQRKVLNPVFSASSVKAIEPVFLSLATKLSTKLARMVDGKKHDVSCSLPADLVTPDNTVREDVDGVVFDVSRWLGAATLDAIGRAGFGREFRSLDEDADPFVDTITNFMKSSTAPKGFAALFAFLLLTILPQRIFQALPFRRAEEIKSVKRVLNRESASMVADRRRALEEDPNNDNRDLMSTVLRANDATDSKAQMTLEEIEGQICTFLLAGHETSSTALSWALYELSRDKARQSKLRAEVREARQRAKERGDEDITAEDVTALPYLDAVVREILRLRSPVTATIRISSHACVLPLSKPIKLNDGTETTELVIPKDAWLTVPILPMNRRRDVWGEDGHSFRPERWLEEDAGAGGELKGASVYANIMSFIGGQRSCIGYRFAISEIKCFLALLVADIEFHDVGLEIEGRMNVVMRPRVKGQVEKGNQLPIRATRAA